MLFDQKPHTYKSPVQYPGGKHFARQILSDYVPAFTNRVVSPFFGGGSLELFLTKRGIRVEGYDLFEPLVTFWNAIQKDPKKLYNEINSLMNDWERSYFEKIKKQGYEVACEYRQSAHFYLMQSLSYNSTGFRGNTIKNYEINEDGKPVNPTGKSWGIMFNHDEVRDFHNPLISVKQMDFAKSLILHNGMFAYCDPPYPEVSGMYGDSKKYHENFDHKKLKYILDNRKGDWMLSYNDCQTVRNMYPTDKYSVIELNWKQGSKKEGVGHELLIRRKD